MKSFLFPALFLVFLSGCASREVTSYEQIDKQLVEISGITRAIKCALNNASFVRRDGRGFSSSEVVAEIHYTFQLVDTSKLEGSIEANKIAPFVFAFAGGSGSILPSLSGSVEQTNTVTSEVSGIIPLKGVSSIPMSDSSKNLENACDSLTSDARSKLGFERWLAANITQLDDSARYAPIGFVNQIKLTADFGVQKTGHGQMDFSFVFLTGGVSSTRERNDVQKIELTIRGKTKDDSEGHIRTMRIDNAPDR